MHEYEKDLLMEAQVLQTLHPLFETFCAILEGELQEHGEYLDDYLKLGLGAVLALVSELLEDGVTFTPEDEHGRELKPIKIPSIIKSLEDVMDEIQTLQAGKPTKKGVPMENGDD